MNPHDGCPSCHLYMVNTFKNKKGCALMIKNLPNRFSTVAVLNFLFSNFLVTIIDDCHDNCPSFVTRTQSRRMYENTKIDGW